MNEESYRILVVIAHPDDEVLGAGGLLLQSAEKGFKTGVVTLASRANARYERGTEERLRSEQKKALDFLKVSYISNHDYPDAELSTVPHLNLVRSIEEDILEFRPDIVVTHWYGDLHEDHRVVSKACQEAIRIQQRRTGRAGVESLWYMEVPSSTDWALERRFNPNLYLELSKEEVEAKEQAMEFYSEAVRPDPHSRARLKAFAELRGAQVGLFYAEAFEVAYQIIWNK